MRTQFRPTGSQQHFKIVRPLETHWRAATCREVDCPWFIEGWRTIVPTVGDKADYIRHRSGRHFTEKQVEGGMSEFAFPAGQEAGGFHEYQHRRPLDKQEFFTHEAGGIRRLHVRPTDWTEHFNEETDKTRRALERG